MTDIALAFVAFGALFFISAFFSGSETAIMAVNRLRLRDLAERGDKRARHVETLLGDTGRLLSGILLGNNFANVMLASLATALAVPLWGDLAPLYVSPILTVLLLIFAEIVPKSIAADRSLPMARLCATPLLLFIRLARPLVALTSALAGFFVRVLTRRHDDDEEDAVSHRDLATMADVGHEQGALDTMTREMIHGVVDFSDTLVSDILIPRFEIVSLGRDEGLAGFRRIVEETGHTRVPVWGENEEDILGILHAKDLIVNADAKLEDLLHPAEFVPESAALTRVLRRLQNSRSQMLFVVDEYGGLEGLVTAKDVLEELVGDLEDEHEEGDGRRVRRARPGCVIADATVTLRYLKRKTGIDFGEMHARTLGGLLVNSAADDLKPGTMVEIEGMKCTVIATKGRFLQKVRIDY